MGTPHTWISDPIDFIMTDKQCIQFNTGSDHVLVRCTQNIICKVEINSTLRPALLQAGE